MKHQMNPPTGCGMLAFVGSRTTTERQARGLGLSVFRVDDGFTQWQALQTLPLRNPSFLLANAAARRLYTVHGDFGEVSALAVDGAGRLTLLNQQAVQGRNPVHLERSADGRHLLVANYASGSIAALPVLADGSLGAVASTLELPGTPGPHRVEQIGSHPHQLLRWPGTDLFIVPDKGLDRVHVVQLAPGGKLELIGQAVTRSGAGPRHAALDPAQQRLWVANELDSTVAAYRFDTSSGRLQAERILGLLPDDFCGESRAAGITLVGNNLLFVSNRGHNSVTSLQVNTDDGALVRRQWQATGGTTPRFLTPTPDGRCLIVANEGSDTIGRWRIGADGALEDGRVVAQTGSPVCVAFMPVVG
ncbi:MAG: lactonase family protein [Rubrivivax sp.]